MGDYFFMMSNTTSCYFLCMGLTVVATDIKDEEYFTKSIYAHSAQNAKNKFTDFFKDHSFQAIWAIPSL